MIEEHGRYTGRVFFEIVFLTSHKEIKELTCIGPGAVKTLGTSDRLCIGRAGSVEMGLQDVVEATIGHSIMMDAIGCARNLLAQTDAGVGNLKLDGVVFGVFLISPRCSLLDGLLFDIAADLTQREMLEIAPQAVDELVCEVGSGTHTPYIAGYSVLRTRLVWFTM